jgi:hypothetical protein
MSPHPRWQEHSKQNYGYSIFETALAIESAKR